jgi:hypothetical protein
MYIMTTSIHFAFYRDYQGPGGLPEKAAPRVPQDPPESEVNMARPVNKEEG